MWIFRALWQLILLTTLLQIVGRPVYIYGLISLPSLMKAILQGITKIYILITLQQYVLVFLRDIIPIVDTIFLTFRNDSGVKKSSIRGTFFA